MTTPDEHISMTIISDEYTSSTPHNKAEHSTEQLEECSSGGSISNSLENAFVQTVITVPPSDIPENPVECTTPNLDVIPKFVFIIPYRNRSVYLQAFVHKMGNVLQDIPKTDYKVFVIHQNDSRKFNRGAIKNIGFLYVKNKYPHDYKQITLVFNDVDIFPLQKNYLNYITTKGVVKHFFGFKYTLGGIVSIVGEDFERINGFPNFWAWGFEDNLIQKRIINAGMYIDRSNFYDLSTDMNDNTRFACINSGLKRSINKDEYIRFTKQTTEGINVIHGVQLNDDTSNQIPPHIVIPNNIESEIPLLVKTTSESIHTKTIDLLNSPYDEHDTPLEFTTVHIKSFYTDVPEDTVQINVYDLRNGAVPFKGVMNTKRNPRIYMEF